MGDWRGWMGIRTVAAQEAPLSRDELRARMQEIGRERYHHKHPFHLLMHEGCEVKSGVKYVLRSDVMFRAE